MTFKNTKLYKSIEDRFGKIKGQPSFQVILPQESLCSLGDEFYFDVLFSIYPVEEFDQLITNNEKYISLHIALNKNKITAQDIYDATIADTNYREWELIEYIIGFDYFVTKNKIMTHMDYYDSFFETEDLPNEISELITIFQTEYLPAIVEFIEQEVKKIDVDAIDPSNEDLLLSNYNIIDVLDFKY